MMPWRELGPRTASQAKKVGRTSSRRESLRSTSSFRKMSPVPPSRRKKEIEAVFGKAAEESKKLSLAAVRHACFRSLEVDGIAPYPYIPSIELFCLARWLLLGLPEGARASRLQASTFSEDVDPASSSPQWLILRIHVWHHKLLTQPSLGPGSSFSRSSLDGSPEPAREHREGARNCRRGLSFIPKATHGRRRKRRSSCWKRPMCSSRSGRMPWRRRS